MALKFRKWELSLFAGIGFWGTGIYSMININFRTSVLYILAGTMCLIVSWIKYKEKKSHSTQ